MKLTRKKRNKIAFWLAIVSCVFLFISGTTGTASLRGIEDFVLKFLDLTIVRILFFILSIAASLGAISVLVGAFLIKKNKIVLARVLIILGSGAGFLSVVLGLIVSIATSEKFLYSYLSFSSLGVIFAIASQLFSRRKLKNRKKGILKRIGIFK
jgi:hypothetical protein